MSVELNNHSNIAVISIHSRHASKIFSGAKRAELRKSFNEAIRLVFLYETAPTSAITGCFFVSRATKEDHKNSIRLASQLGVDQSSASRYFAQRNYGWVIEISQVIAFKEPVRRDRLRELNHYFAPPQAFAYLHTYEALTQELIAALVRQGAGIGKLKRMSREGREEFSKLILSDVGSAYEGIDEDFVQQILDRQLGTESAFSTNQKIPLEFQIGEQLVGFTVLTEKVHGAWKTGPSILLPELRGLGLGQLLRAKIEKYCRRKGARSVYCTCASNKPGVISYLLNSGMEIQARLRAHLSEDRDEMVFSKIIRSKDETNKRRQKSNLCSEINLGGIRRVKSTNPHCSRVVKEFVRLMKYWYFEPGNDLEKSIISSMKYEEQGIGKVSAKPRRFYVCFAKDDRPVIMILGTEKRSNMVKLNLISSASNINGIVEILNYIKRDWKNVRRFYLTIPATQMMVISAINSVGFRFEGILENPFGTNVNHVCFGKNKN